MLLHSKYIKIKQLYWNIAFGLQKINNYKKEEADKVAIAIYEILNNDTVN